MSKIFDLNNTNNLALVIPQGEGATEDDTGHGSVGDATAKHVSSLSNADRQLWQGLIITKSGSIYRVEPSPFSHDFDPFDIVRQLDNKELHSKECAKNIARRLGKKLDKSFICAQEEAVKEEIERREKSEDTYDKAELIPYHQMEQFPGMEKHIEIPSTPRDWLVYMGNTNQPFLDVFPEGHPDSNIITHYIHMLDRDDAGDNWYAFVQSCLDKENVKPYVARALSRLITNISKCDGYENEHVINALQEIDDNFRIEYINKAAKLLAGDSILHLLLHKEKEWSEKASKGLNVHSSIKSFGRVLHENHRDKMKSHHWARYRRLRDKFAPQVVVRGKDINRCRVYDLMSTLRINREAATKLWHARPFESVGHAMKQGYINRSSFADSDKADKYLEEIEYVCSQKSLSELSALASKLVRLQGQQENKTAQQQQEWKTIWFYYRILREDLIKEVNNERQKDARRENELRLFEDYGREETTQEPATTTTGV